MNRTAFLAIGACLLVMLSTVGSRADEGYRRYRIESGIVEYKLSGTQQGTETIYFDDWGMREAKFTETVLNLMGMTQKTSQLTILDGEWIYNIDLSTRKGTKLRNTTLLDLAEGSESKDLSEVGEQMMTSMGGKKIGTEVVAGKECDVWEIKSMSTKTWVWKGITLKTVANLAGMETVSIATRVEENAKIPDDKLVVPTHVDFTEGRDLEALIENLKKKKE